MCQHASLVVEKSAQTRLQLVHPLAGIVDHGDLEQRTSDLHALTHGPGLDVGPFYQDVLSNRPMRNAERVEMLFRYEQHLTSWRVRMGAALETLIRDGEHPLTRLRASAPPPG